MPRFDELGVQATMSLPIMSIITTSSAMKNPHTDLRTVLARPLIRSYLTHDVKSPDRIPSTRMYHECWPDKFAGHAHNEGGIMKVIKTRAPALSPMYELGQFENRIRRLLEEPFDLVTSPMTFTPTVEIREIDSEFIVTVELAGMKKDEVDIEYENGVLFIRGEKLETPREEKRNLLVWERQYGAFQRSFMLPNTIDQEKIKAEFLDGVLTITLPKAEFAKGKKIQIAGVVK
jgi:HSP20 family protein